MVADADGGEAVVVEVDDALDDRVGPGEGVVGGAGARDELVGGGEGAVAPLVGEAGSGGGGGGGEAKTVGGDEVVVVGLDEEADDIVEAVEEAEVLGLVGEELVEGEGEGEGDGDGVGAGDE